ncbi:Putative transposase of IS4/5 family [Actinomadura meyerae]|uniref:Putative transposase of IS4/5 family n=1 Tax=Actinomadura meyerae TaxID=240840 RepID=A0A239P7Z7_9ACTN|nr:Putative transposase of IS4/5 family [Actinomadura meyerae]
MLWRLRTGAPWRDLPERYGPWQTVYERFARWEAWTAPAMLEAQIVGSQPV